MDLDEALRCLADADAGRLHPELCEGRYAAVSYVPDGTPSTEDDLLAELSAETWWREAASVYAAFDLIAEHLIAPTDDDDPQELLAWLTDFDDDLIDELRERGISSAPRQVVAATLMGAAGAVDIVTEEHWRDAYLGETPLLFPGPGSFCWPVPPRPHQEVAVGILELQPTGAPGRADRALIEACRADDPGAISAAVAAGGAVNGLDEWGMSPLHEAVAHLRRAAVEALLAAGADVRLQAGFGNAPQFAALDAARRVGSHACRIDGDLHWQIVQARIDAGANVNAANRVGATLLDLAAATVPYPQQIVDFLLAADARCAHLRGKQLHQLVRPLPYPDLDWLRVRVNEVRMLLRSGVNPNTLIDDRTPLSELLTMGYHEHEVPGDILLALVDELISHGAADLPDQDGRTALDRAQAWFAGGLTHYGATVERLRSAPQRLAFR